MNAALIRKLNVVKLFHAIRENPGSSQRDLNQITKLDKATTSTVVNQLVESGLVARSVKETNGRKGRPEKALVINQGIGILLGAEITPNHLTIIATYLDGTIVAEQKQTYSKTDTTLERLLELSDTLVDTLLLENNYNYADIRGLGISISPQLLRNINQSDSTYDILVDTTDLSKPVVQQADIQNFVNKQLSKRYPFPIYLDDEMNTSAVAEKLFGACKEVADYIYIAEHSRLGAGLYINNTLIQGKHGFAGSLAHTTVMPNGLCCDCGRKGCLKAYITEQAILSRLNEHSVQYSSLEEAFANTKNCATTLEILQEACDMLMIALVNAISLINPELVILGGKLRGFMLLPELELAKNLKKNLANTLKDTVVTASALDEQPVALGSIAIALEGFLALPPLHMQQLIKSSAKYKKVTSASELYLRNFHKEDSSS